MNSWLIVILLTILLMISIGITLIFRWDIKKMTNQLERIVDNFGTNELIRTHTHSNTLNQFITKINRLIHLYKHDQQNKDKKEMKLKQEITNISHDLRTPLTSIKGFTELLTDPTLSDKEKKESLTIVQKKIDKLTMMVDLFYEISQIHSSDKPMLMEEQLLNQIVIEAMFLFYDDFEKKHLKIHVDERNIPSVLANYEATNRIVINIIQNALRYAKSFVAIHFIEQDEYIQLTVINDINEIDHTELHRIFDRTYTLEASRTDGQLGLGLHIVQQLIHNQGGDVASTVHNNEFKLDVFFKKWN